MLYKLKQKIYFKNKKINNANQVNIIFNKKFYL